MRKITRPDITNKDPEYWEKVLKSLEIVRVIKNPDPGTLWLRLPRTETIEEKHIHKAYVLDDKYEAERIEQYQFLTLVARQGYVTPFIPDPYEGRPLFVSFSVSGVHVTENGSEKNYIMDYPYPLVGFPRGVFKQGITDDDSRRYAEVRREIRVPKKDGLELSLVVPKGGKSLEDEFKNEFSRYRLKQYEAASLGLPNPTEWYCGSARIEARVFLQSRVSKY